MHLFHVSPAQAEKHFFAHLFKALPPVLEAGHLVPTQPKAHLPAGLQSGSAPGTLDSPETYGQNDVTDLLRCYLAQ